MSPEDKAAIKQTYRQLILEVMATMMLADGVIEPNEIATIQRIYARLARLDLSVDQVKQVALDLQQSDDDLLTRVAVLAPKLNDTGREQILRAALLVGQSDRKLDASEHAMVTPLAEALGMRSGDVSRLLVSTRR